MRCQPAITICRLPSVYQSHCCHNNVSALPQSVCTTSAHCLHGLQGSMSDSAKWTHSYTCINKLLLYWQWMVQNRCHLPNNFGSCWIFPIPHNEPEMPLSKLPVPWEGDTDHYLIHCSLHPPDSHIKNGISIGSAVTVQLMAVTNRRNIGNNRPHLCTLCMRLSLIITPAGLLQADAWQDNRHG